MWVKYQSNLVKQLLVNAGQTSKKSNSEIFGQCWTTVKFGPAVNSLWSTHKCGPAVKGLWSTCTCGQLSCAAVQTGVNFAVNPTVNFVNFSHSLLVKLLVKVAQARSHVHER